MAEKMKKRIIVGATGASGLPLLVKCLEIIRENLDFESYLIMSSSAELTLRQETELEPEDVKRLADHVCAPGEIGAKPASGSFKTEGDADRALQHEDDRGGSTVAMRIILFCVRQM